MCRSCIVMYRLELLGLKMGLCLSPPPTNYSTGDSLSIGYSQVFNKYSLNEWMTDWEAARGISPVHSRTFHSHCYGEMALASGFTDWALAYLFWQLLNYFHGSKGSLLLCWVASHHSMYREQRIFLEKEHGNKHWHLISSRSLCSLLLFYAYLGTKPWQWGSQNKYKQIM